VASAARHYASAVAAAPATHRARTQKAMRYAEAFAADDVGPAFDQFLASLQDEPRSPIQLMNLAALLGELLPTPQQLQQLRLFLLNLALDLSPEDQPIRRARGELLQQIQGKR